MWFNLNKFFNFLKVKFKYFYIYLLFKFKPVVFYGNNTLRGFGKSWLIIKTASVYKMFIISMNPNITKRQAQFMKEKGIIKNIPTIYGGKNNFNGFGNVDILLDTNIETYNTIKTTYQNLNIVGGFVFDPNKRTISKTST